MKNKNIEPEQISYSRVRVAHHPSVPLPCEAVQADIHLRRCMACIESAAAYNPVFKPETEALSLASTHHLKVTG